jgi:hypothetical protein
MHEILLASARLFADETTMPVLDPGRGRTKKGFAWAVARDDRAWGGADPPAVVFHYAPGRGAEHEARPVLADVPVRIEEVLIAAGLHTEPDGVEGGHRSPIPSCRSWSLSPGAPSSARGRKEAGRLAGAENGCHALAAAFNDLLGFGTSCAVKQSGNSQSAPTEPWSQGS